MSDERLDDLLEAHRWATGILDPLVLDWTGAMRVPVRLVDPPTPAPRPHAPPRQSVVFGPAPPGRLPYPDASMDVVVVATADAVDEARRVARDAVVLWPPDGPPALAWTGPRRAPVVPAVSVVVGTADAPEALAACLDALAANTLAGDAIEVVVADAGERDVHALVTNRADPLPVSYVRADPPQGPTAALDVGARAARAPVLVLLEGHVRVQRGWPVPLVQAITGDEAAGVARAAVPAGTPGALHAICRRLLFHVGGLNPRVDPGRAVADLCARVAATGARTVDVPRSVAR